MKVFVDTAAFCALSIPKDRHNGSVLKKRRALLFTSDYVLDEVYTLLKIRGSLQTAVVFLDKIGDANINLLRITEPIEMIAKAIFRRFEDPKLSFTDCTSFALITMNKIEAVFSFDNHFRYHPYPHLVEFLAHDLP